MSLTQRWPLQSGIPPEGIDMTQLLDALSLMVDERLLGFDLTEVSPHYDSGLTATQAAYIVLETMYVIESRRP
jgi:agmatinase